MIQDHLDATETLLRGANANLKRGAIDEFPLQCPCLADEALKQHADCHSRRERVRIDYEIRPAQKITPQGGQGTHNFAITTGRGIPVALQLFLRAYFHIRVKRQRI